MIHTSIDYVLHISAEVKGGLIRPPWNTEPIYVNIHGAAMFIEFELQAYI